MALVFKISTELVIRMTSFATVYLSNNFASLLHITYGHREKYYKALSHFGRNLGIVLESERIYNTLPEEELKEYKKISGFSRI